MAAVDPFSAMIVPLKYGVNAIEETAVRAVKPPLDAALLRSKLETLRREQEATRARREKRNAFRNGYYVPQAAAKSFRATTTMFMSDIVNSTTATSSEKHISAPSISITEPSAADGRVCVPPKQLYAALNIELGNGVAKSDGELSVKLRNRDHTLSEKAKAKPFGLDRQDPTTLAKKRHHSTSLIKEELPASGKAEPPAPSLAETPYEPIRSQGIDKQLHEDRDSMNPSSSEVQPLLTSEESSLLKGRRHLSSRSPRSSPGSTETTFSPIQVDLETSQYRRDGAAKLKNGMASTLVNPSSTGSERSVCSELEKNRRVSKFLECDLFRNTAEYDSGERAQSQGRPKPTASDRPDWTQSENETRHTRHFFQRTAKDESAAERIRKRSSVLEYSVLARFAGVKPVPLEKDSAVKIIKQEEQSKRRGSLVSLFKFHST